jgi:hypothetical protein
MNNNAIRCTTSRPLVNIKNIKSSFKSYLHGSSSHTKMSDDLIHVLYAFEEQTGSLVHRMKSRNVRCGRPRSGEVNNLHNLHNSSITSTITVTNNNSDYLGIYVVHRDNVAGGFDELLLRNGELVFSEPLAEGSLLTFPCSLVHQVTALESRDMIRGGRRGTIIIGGLSKQRSGR